MEADCSTGKKSSEDTYPSLVTNPSNTITSSETALDTVDPVSDFLGQFPADGGKDESPPDRAERPSNSSVVSPIELEGTEMLECFTFVENLTEEEKFHIEVNRWEEFYDQMQRFLLQDKKANVRVNKNILRAAEHYTLGSDGNIYYSKLAKDGITMVRLLVIRDHSERTRICRSIHLDTGHDHLHNRRDKMLDLVGRKYFWKGQRRDICQCIASCEVCSVGLGARRKTKPPAQKRDVPHGGPPQRKKAKVEKFKLGAGKGKRRSKLKKNKSNPHGSAKGSVERTSEVVAGTLEGYVEEKQLSFLSDGIQTRSKEWVEHLQPVLLNAGGGGERSSNMEGDFSCSRQDDLSERGRVVSDAVREVPVLYVGPTEDTDGLKELQPDPAVGDSNSDQAASSIVDIEEFSANSSPASDTKKEVESVYRLLFNVPSTQSHTFPSVVDAVYLGMKMSVDIASCLKVFDNLMLRILSLGSEYSVIVTPCLASAYCVGIFASVIALDPLRVTSQVCSSDLPLAVIHDAYCAHFQQSSTSRSEMGMLKTGTSLTGCYNWNLGSATDPMDREALRMAVQSNRVAAVLYQPYSYGQHSQQVSLEEVSSVCHVEGSGQSSHVSVVLDASDMLPHVSNVWATVVSQLRHFLQQGADMVLMPPLNKLGGVSQSCVIVGSAELLEGVWENMAALQGQVCLPLHCQSHDLVDAVVTYKAIQHS